MSFDDWHEREDNWGPTCRCDVCMAMAYAVKNKSWPEEQFKLLGPRGKDKVRRLYMAEMVKWDTFKTGGET